MAVANLPELLSKCNFSESCLDQLSRELPKFLNRKAELESNTQSLASMLRNVAATESNPMLQDCLFKCALKYETLQGELNTYKNCATQTNVILLEAKSLLITPLREVIADASSIRAIPDQHPESQATIEYQKLKRIEQLLPIHSAMFENHRVGYMKSILVNFLFAELRYHCKVIEELSPILEALSDDPNKASYDDESNIPIL